MLVNAVFYRSSHRHLWALVGLIDCDTPECPDPEVEEFIEERRERAEEMARNDDQNKGDYEIVLMSGIEEDAAYCGNLARKLPPGRSKTLR